MAGVEARGGQGSVTEGLADVEFGSYSERSENYWRLQSGATVVIYVQKDHLGAEGASREALKEAVTAASAVAQRLPCPAGPPACICPRGSPCPCRDKFSS